MLHGNGLVNLLKILSSLRGEITNFIWLSGDKIVKLSLGFFVGLWVARYLEPQQYGILSFWISIITFFEIVGSLGSQTVVVKELVQSKDKSKVFLNVLYIRFFSSFLACMLFFVTCIFFNTSNAETFIYFFSLILLFRVSDIFKYFFESQVRSKFTAWSESFSLIICSLIKIVGILTNQSLSFFFYITVLESLLILFFLLFFFKIFGKLTIKSTGPDINYIKLLLIKYAPFLLSGASIIIYQKVDQIMIGSLLSSEGVGYYAIASKISEIWWFVPVAIGSTFFPRLINSFSDNVAFNKTFKILLFSLFWVSSFAALFNLLVSEYVIMYLLGDNYFDSISILNIYFFSGIFVSVSILSDSWYQINGRSKYILYKSLLGAMLNVPLNFIFIEFYGVIGAAYATLITLATITFVFDLIFKKTRELFFVKVRSILFIS